MIQRRAQTLRSKRRMQASPHRRAIPEPDEGLLSDLVRIACLVNGPAVLMDRNGTLFTFCAFPARANVTTTLRR